MQYFVRLNNVIPYTEHFDIDLREWGFFGRGGGGEGIPPQ